MSLDKATYTSGEDIVVSFSRLAGATAQDWIAIYPSAIYPSVIASLFHSATVWLYVCQSDTQCASPVSSGVVTFGSATPGGIWPLSAGEYHAWYFHDDSYTPISTTPASPIAFNVTALDCGAPSQSHWEFSSCSQKYGGSCTASCETGFIGYPSLMCHSSGDWRYAGSCSPVDCGAPSQSHWEFSSCSQKYGGSCTASCETGFIGYPSLMCHSSGDWRYAGSCDVRCGLPALHSMIFESSCQSRRWCSGRCAPGYIQSDPPSALCSNGRWSYHGSCRKGQWPFSDHPWIDLGPGCCSGILTSLFGGHVSDLEDCKKACLTFPTCGYVVYRANDALCEVLSSAILSCSTRDLSDSGVDCGDVRSYKLAGRQLCSLYTFGRNDQAQLGDGTTKDKHKPTMVRFGSSDLSAIAADESQTAFIERHLYAFGESYWRQRGTASNKAIVTAFWVTAVAIKSGQMAYVSHGRLYTSGFNLHGQLGDGTSLSRPNPKPIDFSADVTAVAIGSGHMAVISGGKLYTFGHNNYGQLGDGTTSDKHRPTEIWSLGAVVTAVATGSYHTAVISGGKLYTFGRNNYGQLGDGTTSDKHNPAEISPLGADVTAVAAGLDHTAVIRGRKLYTFGHNPYGQLGDGTTSAKHNPTEISSLGADVTAVAAGRAHTIVISGGKLYTFGGNYYGQLGDGTTSNKHKPVEISQLGTGTELTEVAAGAEHTAVIQCARGVSTSKGCWSWAFDMGRCFPPDGITCNKVHCGYAGGQNECRGNCHQCAKFDPSLCFDAAQGQCVACPAVDCTWGDFSSWSTCSATCGGGLQYRLRTKIAVETNGGTCMGDSAEYRDCSTDACYSSGQSSSQEVAARSISIKNVTPHWKQVFLADANHSTDLFIEVQLGTSDTSVQSVNCAIDLIVTFEAVMLGGHRSVLFYKCTVEMRYFRSSNGVVNVFAIDTAGVASANEVVAFSLETGFVNTFVSAVKKVAKPLEYLVSPSEKLRSIYPDNNLLSFDFLLRAYVRPIQPSDLAEANNQGMRPYHFKDEGMVGFRFKLLVGGYGIGFILAAAYQYHSTPYAVLAGTAWVSLFLPFPVSWLPDSTPLQILLEGSIQGTFRNLSPPSYLDLEELQMDVSLELRKSFQIPLIHKVPFLKDLAYAELSVSGKISLHTALVQPGHTDSSGIEIDAPGLPPMALKRTHAILPLALELTVGVGIGSLLKVEVGSKLELAVGIATDRLRFAWGVRVSGEFQLTIYELGKRVDYREEAFDRCWDGPEDLLCGTHLKKPSAAWRRMVPQAIKASVTVRDVAAYRQVRPDTRNTFKGDAIIQKAVLVADAIPSLMYSIAVCHGSLETYVLAVWTEHTSARNRSVSGTDLGGYTMVMAGSRDPRSGEEVPVLSDPQDLLSPRWNDQQPHTTAIADTDSYVTVWTRTGRDGFDPFARTGLTRIMYLVSAGGPLLSVGTPTSLTEGFDIHPFVASNPYPRGRNPLASLVVWLRSHLPDQYQVGAAYMYPGHLQFVSPGALRREAFTTSQRLVAALYGDAAAVVLTVADVQAKTSKIHVSSYIKGVWTPFEWISPNHTNSADATITHRNAEGKFLVCFVDQHTVVCTDTVTRETMVVAAMRAGSLTATRADEAVRLSWLALDVDNTLVSVLLYDTDPIISSGTQLVANSGDPDRITPALAIAAKGNVLHILSEPQVLQQSPPGCIRRPVLGAACATSLGQAALEYYRYVLVCDLALQHLVITPDFATGSFNLSVTVASIGSLGNPGGRLTVDGGGVFAETRGSVVTVPPLASGDAIQMHVVLDGASSVILALESGWDDNMTNNLINLTDLVDVRLTGVWNTAQTDFHDTEIVASVRVTGSWIGAVTVRFLIVLASSPSDELELGVATAQRPTVEIPSSELNVSLFVDLNTVPENAIMVVARLISPQQFAAAEPARSAFAVANIASSSSGVHATPMVPATLSYTQTSSLLLVEAKGPEVVHITLYEIGREPWTWKYTIANSYPTPRTVNVFTNHELLVAQYNGSQTIEPSATLTVTVQFLVPLQHPPPQRFDTTFTVADGGLAVHQRRVTIYVLPEPWLSGTGPRRGSYFTCRIMHNGHNPFESMLEIIGDTNPALFRGVTWDSAPSLPSTPGTRRQRRLTIPPTWWQENLRVRLYATVYFVLPSNRSVEVSVRRQCEVFVNSGPDGSRATFTVLPLIAPSAAGDPLRRQSTAAGLDPLQQHVVHIRGWAHHSTMYYSVWFHWDASPGIHFQLTVDAASTEHVITAPAHTRGAAIRLLVRATDEWEVERKTCTACEVLFPLRPVNHSTLSARLDGLLGAPWQSLTPVLEFLALGRDFEDVAEGWRAAFLDKVRLVAAQQPARWFINQTAPTFWAQLRLRSHNVTAYDLDLCGLFNDLVEAHAPDVSGLGLDSIARIYGAVLQRYVAPAYNYKKSVWDRLQAARASVASKPPMPTRGRAAEAPIPPALSPTARTAVHGDAAMVQPAVTLTDYVFKLTLARAGTAALRAIRCLHSEPLLAPMSNRCFTSCSLRVSRDEMGLNLSSVAPSTGAALPPGGREMVHWMVANRAWLQSVQNQLPDVVVVVSVRIGQPCHFDALRYHLAGVLWRVWLLNADTMAELPLVAAHGITVPIPSDLATQDCVTKVVSETFQGSDRGGYRTAPRSTMNGYCLTDRLGWVGITSPEGFPGVHSPLLPWLLLWLLLAAVVSLITGCCLLWLLFRKFKTCGRFMLIRMALGDSYDEAAARNGTSLSWNSMRASLGLSGKASLMHTSGPPTAPSGRHSNLLEKSRGFETFDDFLVTGRPAQPGSLLDVEWMNAHCGGSRTPAEAHMLSQIQPEFRLEDVSLGVPCFSKSPPGNLLDVEWMNVHCGGSRTPAEAHMLSQIQPEFRGEDVSLGVPCFSKSPPELKDDGALYHSPRHSPADHLF